ncbi:MAG: preprotein translocase subunit SecG [Ruminobacter sp.]|nr:preprotein translocase subunit SecG [Ruminobacter sp.]
MDYAYSILIVLDLIVAIILAAFILMQQGKGASMGASFGAGASNTLFGSVGSANFFVKSTWILATVFAVLTISLGYITTHRSKLSSDDFSVIVAEDKKSASADENKADTEKKSLTEKAGEAVDKAAEQTKAAYEDGKQAVGNAAEQAKAAYEDGKQAVSDVADSVQNKVSEAVDQVNDKVAEVNKAVGENVEAAKASLNNAADDVKKVVTPDPAESVDKKETNTTETEK